MCLTADPCKRSSVGEPDRCLRAVLALFTRAMGLARPWDCNNPLARKLLQPKRLGAESFIGGRTNPTSAAADSFAFTAVAAHAALLSNTSNGL
jgi:hypothetical protein